MVLPCSSKPAQNLLGNPCKGRKRDLAKRNWSGNTVSSPSFRYWLALVAWLALAAPLPTCAALSNDTPVLLRVIPQFQDALGTDVAAWTPDSRFLLTANFTSRTLRLWDLTQVEQRRGAPLIDRIVVPASILSADDGLCVAAAKVGDPCSAQPVFDFSSLEIGSTGDHAILWFKAKVGENYLRIPLGLNLKTRRFDPSAGEKEPLTHAAGISRTPHFPVSPNGRLAPAQADIWKGSLEDAPDISGLFVGPAPAHDAFGPSRVAATGGPVTKLGRDPVRLVGAAISPSGERIALAWTASSSTRVAVIDVRSGRRESDVPLPEYYDRVEWMDELHLVVLQQGHYGDAAPVLPVAVIDVDRRSVSTPLRARCFPARTPDGFIALGVGACRTGGDTGLWA